MAAEDVAELIAELHRLGTETAYIETKDARGGTPKPKIREALSAFANTSGGGVIVLGIAENAEFDIVGVGDVQQVQTDIMNISTNEMEPPLRPEIQPVEIDGKPVIAVFVSEIAPAQKPCYYRRDGIGNGAFVRVGASNRKMTDYEIFSFQSSAHQQADDQQCVSDAVVADLDQDALEAYVTLLRRQRPRAVENGASRVKILLNLNIVRLVDDQPRPTLAGLLTFGRYPQRFLPQLRITFVQHPDRFTAVEGSSVTGSTARFVDNRDFDGPIPIMLDDAVTHVFSRIASRSVIEGLFRRDIPEYPEVAIREALVNAIVHRDYSRYVRGNQVQIDLYPDRLVIQNPGGLYGTVTEESLGSDEQPTSTRNMYLARFLEDLRIVEKRGSGIRTMLQAMRGAGLKVPDFRDQRTRFVVTFMNHTLLDEEAVRWLNRFSSFGLHDRQRYALAYLRGQGREGRIVNSAYRRINDTDTTTATQELQGLVRLGFLEPRNTGRWTVYVLTDAAREGRLLEPPTGGQSTLVDDPSEELNLRQLAEFIREHGAIRNPDVRELFGMQSYDVSRWLARLVADGILIREGERRWARYRLASDS
ncbi:MAG: putative DNA binding domain-containing protein [Chloroflexota bacterium]|nr:putative DNA binding domain-containing protein [Chloroflexota bacterium]